MSQVTIICDVCKYFHKVYFWKLTRRKHCRGCLGRGALERRGKGVGEGERGKKALGQATVAVQVLL